MVGYHKVLLIFEKHKKDDLDQKENYQITPRALGKSKVFNNCQ